MLRAVTPPMTWDDEDDDGVNVLIRNLLGWIPKAHVVLLKCRYNTEHTMLSIESQWLSKYYIVLTYSFSRTKNIIKIIIINTNYNIEKLL